MYQCWFLCQRGEKTNLERSLCIGKAGQILILWSTSTQLVNFRNQAALSLWSLGQLVQSMGHCVCGRVVPAAYPASQLRHFKAARGLLTRLSWGVKRKRTLPRWACTLVRQFAGQSNPWPLFQAPCTWLPVVEGWSYPLGEQPLHMQQHLRTRRKKVTRCTTAQINYLKMESKNSKAAFKQNLQQTESWLTKYTSDTNQTKLKDTSYNYLHSLGESCLWQMLPLQGASQVYSNTLCVSALIHTLNDRQAFQEHEFRISNIECVLAWIHLIHGWSVQKIFVLLDWICLSSGPDDQ